MTRLSTMQLPDGRSVAQISRPETALIFREIFENRCYLPADFSLGGGDVVLDVGANIGMAALFFLDQRPDVVVYAIEPAPALQDALRRNLDIFGDRARIRTSAISAHEGRGMFTYYPESPAASGLHGNPEADAERTRRYIEARGVPSNFAVRMLAGRYRCERFTCELVTLSGFLDEEEIDQVALLKLDCEGSELDALLGIRSEHWRRIRQVVAEVDCQSDRLEAVTTLLEDHGFVVRVSSTAQLEGTGLRMVYASRPGP